MTVHIACTVRDGEEFLPAFLASVQAQTHGDWMLWLRDDGSRDGSAQVIARFARQDGRIQCMPDESRSLGVTRGFAWVLDRIPADATHIMFADADDVWLPDKVGALLDAMTASERAAPGPCLVHSDLVVVDRDLREIHPSFWRYAGIVRYGTSIEQVAVRNPVTGAATMINAALRARMSPIPAGAVLHDWWAACVAALFGRIIALPRATVLYRQHGANATGARRPSSLWPAGKVLREIPGAFRRTSRLRADIAAAAGQAGALLDQFGAELRPQHRMFLEAYSVMPRHRFFRRKVALARLQMLRGHGWVQNVGIFLRG